VLKFSAMEIYNEAVRDLLRPDATQLRLLDDPEVNCSRLLPKIEKSGNLLHACTTHVYPCVYHS
jgi:hypothetical protein